jgi:hypothetical protein
VDPDDEGDDVVQRADDDEPDRAQHQQVDGPWRAQQMLSRRRPIEPGRQRQQRPRRQRGDGDGVPAVHRRPLDAHLVEASAEHQRERQRGHTHQQSADSGQRDAVDESAGRQQGDARGMAKFLDAPEVVVDAAEFRPGEHRP